MSDLPHSNAFHFPTLLLARHGETESNLKKIFQGRTDNPLNDTGLMQARQIQRIIAEIPISAAYISPLQRARQTTEIALKGRKIQIIPDPRLIEIDFGEWEGIPEAEVKVKYVDEYQAYRKDMSKFHPSGGESAVSAWKRSGEWWEEMRGRYRDDETILVIAHQSINACLGCYVAGIDLSQAWQNFKSAPGEVIEIITDPVVEITRLTSTR